MALAPLCSVPTPTPDARLWTLSEWRCPWRPYCLPLVPVSVSRGTCSKPPVSAAAAESSVLPPVEKWAGAGWHMNFLFGGIEDRTRDLQQARWMLCRWVTWTVWFDTASPYSLLGDPPIHSCFHRRAVTQALVPAHPSSCIRVERKEGSMILV